MMRSKSFYIWLTWLCLLIPAMVMAQADESKNTLDLDAIIKKVEAELADLRDKAVTQQHMIQAERMTLMTQLEKTTQHWSSIEESLASERETNSALQNQLAKQKDQLAELEEEHDEFLGALKVKATELSERLNATIVGYERKDLRQHAHTFALSLEKEEPDLVEATRELFYLANEELKSGSEVSWFKGVVIAPGGNFVKADILRLGEIGNFCTLADGTKGLLVRDENENWRLISERLGFFQQKRVEDFLDQTVAGQTEILALPLDVTGGLAIAQRVFSRTIWEYVKAGGIVIIPLILIAVLGLLITIERLIVLARARLRTRQLMHQVNKLCLAGNYQEAEKLCDSVSSPLSSVLKTGLTHRTSSKDVLEESLEEAISHELPALEKFLSFLGVLAVIAPFLGLLGTVTGMISTFNVITIYGTGDPRLLSGGISEALITTQIGLIIAIPLLLLHNYISSRVTRLTEELEANATRLVNLLSASNQSKEK